MSNDRFEDPFASPASGAQQPSEWQGSPVPPSSYVTPRPAAGNDAPRPADADYAQSPPPPGTYPSAAASPASVAVPPPPNQAAPAYAQQPPPAQYPAPNSSSYPPQPPAGYGYAPVYAPTAAPKNWMGITSLILSLVTPIFVITAIPGVVFGHLGLAACKRGEANNRGLALAGVIVGWVMIGLGIFSVAILVLVAVADSSSAY